MKAKLRSALPPAVRSKITHESGAVVSVVKLHGIITPMPSPLARGVINLSSVESAVTKAFDADGVVAVALAINSPGGSPTQSALVADRIRMLADAKGIPVIAFCEDVAASGGYWLACAGDEIIAHPTSMVGSIGVVSQGFGLHGLLERFGVQRRLYTAGENKARLDPFLPEDEADVAWLRGMQDELHTMFADWVRARRGPRLADQNLFTGEVWTGAKGLELGLVDELGTMRGVLEKRFPDARINTVEPKKPLLARLGMGGPGMRGPDGVVAVLDALEHRATWSRFGL